MEPTARDSKLICVQNDEENEEYLMDSLLHDDSSHLPLLSLINLLAVDQTGEENNPNEEEKNKGIELDRKQMVGKSEGSAADRFCDQLDLQRKMLEYRLHQVLDAKSGIGLEGFLAIKTIHEQLSELEENEDYLDKSVSDTSARVTHALTSYHSVTIAQHNLTTCMREIKECIDITESYRKVETLAEEKDFYTAALTIDQLKTKINKTSQKYNFTTQMLRALDSLTARVFEESLESLGKFLEVMSHNLVNVGKDAVENCWACDPDKFIDFTQLAKCFFIAQLFKYEADLISHFREQTQCLLNLILSRSPRVNTFDAFETLTLSLIGYFFTLVRSSSITPHLAENMDYLATMTSLKLNDIIEITIQRPNWSKPVTSGSLAEKMLESICEVLKVFQFYNINSTILERTIQMIFGHICDDQIFGSLNEKQSIDRNGADTMKSFCQRLVDEFESLNCPKLNSTKLDNQKLKSFWTSNRDLYFDNFAKLSWTKSVTGYLNSSDKPFQVINEKWTQIEEEISQNCNERPNSKLSRMQKTFEIVVVENLESLIASRVTGLTSILTMSGIGSEVNEIIQSKEAGPFGELLTFVTIVTSEFKNRQKVSKNLLDHYAQQLIPIIDSLVFHPNITFDTLETISQHINDITKLAKELEISKIDVAEVYSLQTFIDSIMTSEEPDKILQASENLNGNQKLSRLELVSFLKILLNNSQQNKQYSKSVRGKLQLKTSGNLIKKLVKLK